MNSKMRMLLYIFILFPIITLAETTAKDTIEWLNGFINTVNWKVAKKVNNNNWFKKGTTFSYEDFNNNKFSYANKILTHNFICSDGQIDIIGKMKRDSMEEENTINLSKVVKFYKDETTKDDEDVYYHYYSINYHYKLNNGSYTDDTLISTQYTETEAIKRIINALNHLVKIAGGGEKEPF